MKGVWTLLFASLCCVISAKGKAKGKVSTKLAFASYYGSHMILQQAPKQATVWGVGNMGHSLTLTLTEGQTVKKTYSVTVKSGFYPTFQDVAGVWSVLLDAMPSGGPYTLTVEDSKTGETISITDVKFGDVWICSGQSNMQFTMDMVFNATQEMATADDFPDIRLFTVAESIDAKPRTELPKVLQQWSVSSKETVNGGNWKYFSAVCWLYGRHLYKKLNYPIGLVASVWGGTPVEAWSSPDALAACGISQSPHETNKVQLPSVKCDDTYSCPASDTCCKRSDGYWGCCPSPQAVCCNDHLHCCPHGTTCDVVKGTCNRGKLAVPWSERRAGLIGQENDVRCGDTFSCPSGSTCCKLVTGQWGCCPEVKAVCCSDHTHCCPHGTTCDVAQGKCNQNGRNIPWLEKTTAMKRKNIDNRVQATNVEDVKCDDTSSCPSGSTCCKLVTGQWGCCPEVAAVCCSDHTHCCPHGTTCDVAQGKCNQNGRNIPWLEKTTAMKRKNIDNRVQANNIEDVKCDDTSSCPSGSTCCKLVTGQWGCCPEVEAVCCSDHIHCCPHGTTCDVAQGKCNQNGRNIPWLEKTTAMKRKNIDNRVQANNVEDVKCDDTSSCPSGSTCCKLVTGQWGCCPEVEAVCCSDHTHCCPHGTTCDVAQGKCNQNGRNIPWLEKTTAMKRKNIDNRVQANNVEDVKCDDTSSCPSGSTCCKLVTGQWGCCPEVEAVCCSDHIHCCPHGTTCDVAQGKCNQNGGNIPWLEKTTAMKRKERSVRNVDYVTEMSKYVDQDMDLSSLRGPGSKSQLWNAMIHPLLNMTIYGAIWYQGEANASPPTMNMYNCTFPSMINDWRRKFFEGTNRQTDPTFPFGFVQLAPNKDPKKGGEDKVGFSEIRWHQTADFGYVPNQRMKNVFMAVTIDLPDYTSPYTGIHPRDKQDVASRLALSAMAVAYGMKGVKYQGPFPLTFDANPLNVTVLYPNTVIEIKSRQGFELCCTAQLQEYCADDDASWVIAPVAGHTNTSVTLMYSYACEGKKISGIRYAWRQSPCPFKKCAVYDQESQLPGAPFVYFGISDKK